MFKRKLYKKNNRGVTIIEALISIAVVAFVTLTIYQALSSAVRNMGEAKQKVGAIALANEKMEVLRSLPYDDVGVQGGVVSGPVPAEETVSRNGFEYEVKTQVRYVDDPFDGTGEDDSVSTDYKKAQVAVGWKHFGSQELVQFNSIFVPDGIETDAGGGTLSVNTSNASGEIVPNVEFTLDSIEDSPEVLYTTSTDNSGSLILQGVPAQSYRAVLSKSDYEDVRTYPNPPESSFNPVNSDIIIEDGDFYTKDFIINKTGNLLLKALDIYDESQIEGVEVHLEGGKKIGSSPDTYNLDDTSSTDSSGQIDYGDVSPGVYEILNVDELETDDYQYVGTEEQVTFSVAAEENKEVTLLFAGKDKHSLLVNIENQDTGEPLEGAQVNLTAGDFDQSVTTGVDGKAYFPVKTDPETEMENKDYQLEVSKTGYQSDSLTVTVNKLTVEDVGLAEN
ncbi:MAG: prepilin-type N-terminal cleavage/methylation domain-containing protein [Candidatus Moranbacteria bacterium]|nr:prepilin-type N-terminal cleavage/methylation domain-containing protein [Candidatus Moranbacteria bacterium]